MTVSTHARGLTPQRARGQGRWDRRHFGSNSFHQTRQLPQRPFLWTPIPTMPPGQQGRPRSRLRQKTTPRAGASAPRPRRRRRLRATASARAKAAAKALAEKNTRRHARRAACRSLNELARKLHVSASNLVDAKNAAATEVEDLVKLVEKRVQTDADVACLRSAVESYLANGGVFKAPLLDPDEVLPAKVAGHRVLRLGPDERAGKGLWGKKS